jgi:hypothetical protein
VTQHQEHATSSESSDEIEVAANKRTAMLLALLLALITVMLTLLGLFAPQELRGLWSVLCLVLASLSLLVVIRLALVAFSSTPLLLVNHAGVWIHSPLLFGTGTIPWSDIASMMSGTVRFLVYPRTYLWIEFRDKRTLHLRQNAVQRALWLLSGYALLWPRTIFVMDDLLSMTIAELLGRIHVRYRSELAQHDILVS